MKSWVSEKSKNEAEWNYNASEIQGKTDTMEMQGMFWAFYRYCLISNLLLSLLKRQYIIRLF